jgi:Tfp pilus assembly protein PilF
MGRIEASGGGAARARNRALRRWLAAGLLVVAAGCGPPAKDDNPVLALALRSPADYPNRDAAGKNDDGVDHLAREHWRKAAADFQRALDEDPKMAVAHFNLALSLDQLGDHPAAAEHFRAALALAPDDSRIAGNEALQRHLR